jgi:LytR cell envelope-related transcriptional attenuator
LQTPATSPSLEALVRPWRTAAVVASLVAAVELVVLVIAGIALLGPPITRHLRSAAREEVLGAPDQKAPVPLPRSRTRVVVLNGNGLPGAAGATADRVSGNGYRIGAVRNASRSDYARSLVMYRPGRRVEGERLARDLGISVVGPLDGMPLRSIGRAHTVLIVGR